MALDGRHRAVAIIHETPTPEARVIDIYDPAQYLHGVPHEKYATLRREQPVSFQREVDGPGYWAVMRHADVVAVSKNPRVFSSAAGGINIPDPSEEDLEIGA